ncbi:MAG: PH domain-containing protein [Candidatus Pacearchaeota archaeon]|jgi:putative membrane protein
MKKQLHVGAKWQFRFGAYATMLFVVLFFGWILGFAFVGASKALFDASAVNTIIIGIVSFIVFYIVIAIIIGEIYARMAYNRWFYEFTEEQLRIERGIIWKKYSNIPYERVQNVDITRGIIARVCGFSTVNIQTAGLSYSPKGGMTVEGYIPGVPIQEAEHIREFVMKKITKKGRNQGL